MPSRRRKARALAENLQQSLKAKYGEQYPDLDINVSPPGSLSWIFRRARSPRLQVTLKENTHQSNSDNINNFIDEINTLPNASRFGFGIEKLTDSSSGKKVTYKITNPLTLKVALNDSKTPPLRASQGRSEPPIAKETAEDLQQSLRCTFSQQYPSLNFEVTSPSKSAWLLKRARSPRLRVTLKEHSSQKSPNAIDGFIAEISQLPNASEFGIEKLTDSPLGERVKYKITSPDALQRALESEAYERDSLAMAAQQNNEAPFITKEIVAAKLQSLVSDFLAQEKRQSSPLRKSVSMIEHTLNSRIIHHSAPEALDDSDDLKFVFNVTPPIGGEGIGHLQWHASVILPLNQFNTLPHSLLEEWQRVGYFSGRWHINQPTKEDLKGLKGLDTTNTPFKIHIPFINVGLLFKEEIAAGMYRIQQPDNELPLRQAPPPPSILITHEEDDRAAVPPPPSLVVAQDNKRPKSLHNLKVPSPEEARKATGKKKKVRVFTSPTILPDEIKKEVHPSNTTQRKTLFSKKFIDDVHKILDEMAEEYPTQEAFLNSVDGIIEEILNTPRAPDIQPEEPKHIPTIAPGIKENPFIRWDELQRQRPPQSSAATMGETRRFLLGEKPLSFDMVVDGFMKALPLDTGRLNSNRFIRRDALAKELAGIVQQRQENSETTTRFSPRNVLLQDVKQMAQNHPEARIENVETFVRELTSHRSL